MGPPYSSREEAEGVRERLGLVINPDRYKTAVMPVKTDRDTRYRAVFGPFSTRIEAQGALQAYRLAAEPTSGLAEASLMRVR